MKNIWKWTASFLLILTLSGGHAAKSLPRPFAAKYEIAYGPLVLGSGTLRLRHISNNLYKMDFQAVADGVVSWVFDDRLLEESWLELNDNGRLRSTGYRHRRIRGDSSEDHTIFIDYDSGEIRRKDGKLSWEIETTLAADRLSFPFIIASDLVNGFPLQIPHVIVGHHHVWRVSFENRGETERSRGNVTYQVVHLHARDGDEEIDVWLDKNNAYMPVEVSVYEGSGWTTRYYLIQ